MTSLPFRFREAVEEKEQIGVLPFKFREAETEEVPEPSMTQEIGRQVTRTGARVGETLVGLPGDVVQFVKFLSEQLPEPPSIFQREPTFVQRAGREALEQLPTSEELKAVMSMISGGFTDPQSAREEFSDEITSLATALLTPTKSPTRIKNILKAVGEATIAKGVRKGAEKLGAGEKTQLAVEMGSLFLSGLASQQAAKKFVNEQYKEAISVLPEGSMSNTSQLVSKLEGVEKELSKGISTPTKNEVLGTVRELKTKASGGALPTEELIESYRNINERMGSKKLFDELTKSDRKLLRKRYDLVKDAVDNTLSETKEANPRFYNEWKEANQAHAAIAQSEKVRNFVLKSRHRIPGHLATVTALELFTGHPLAAVGTLGAAGAAGIAVKTGEILSQISKSPLLRRHYTQAVNAALKEDFPAFVKGLNQLDREMKKQEKSER